MRLFMKLDSLYFDLRLYVLVRVIFLSGLLALNVTLVGMILYSIPEIISPNFDHTWWATLFVVIGFGTFIRMQIDMAVDVLKSPWLNKVPEYDYWPKVRR